MNFKTILQFPIIAEWSEKFVGTVISQRQLSRRTGDLLRSLGHPISVHSSTDRDLDKNVVVLSAEYDVDRDEAGKRRYLSITITVHPKSVKKIMFDANMSSAFAMDLLEALCHEYRHEHQYRIRDFEEDRQFKSVIADYDLRKQQEYLGIPGEIDAFAVNIAIRLWLFYGDDALKKLSESGLLTYESSPDLWGYFNAFGLQHKVCRRLARKITKNLQELDAWKSERIKGGAMCQDQFTLQSVPSSSASYNFKQAVSE
jgi:hypothetical protein